MINLYDSKTVDFNNNGIGSLKDMINCTVTEELNGVFEFEAEYPLKSNYISEIKNENILKINTGDNNQLFRIKKITPNLKTIKIYGRHITYDLKDNNLDDVYPKKQNCNNMGDWILNRTQYKHNFNFYSDIEKISTARYVDVNPLKAIMGEQDNSFLNLFGGEIVRDNFVIKLLQNRGSNNGYKLSKTKNITGLEIEEDNCSIATRLIPKAYDGIKLPEKYIDSPLINVYPHPYIEEIEFSDVKLKDENSTEEDDEGFDTLEELYEELRRRCYDKFSIENIDKPLTNVKVNFIELSKTENYAKFKNMETLKLGDYVTLITDNYNITLQVIKTKYNTLLKRYIEIELGTKKINFVSSTSSKMSNIINKLDKIDPVSILNQAKINATNQITSALGGYTFKTQNEFFIMDTNDTKTAQRVWRWNLNGLGYSKSGINGPYELAMTQDGQIVADFITTGEMSVERIKGLNEILLTLQKTINFEKEKIGKEYLYLEDCLNIEPLEFLIKGYTKPFSLLYPGNDIYPSNNIYPLDFIETELKILTIIIDRQPKESPTVNKKEIIINIKEPLRSFNNIYDEIFIDKDLNNIPIFKLIRRIEIKNKQLNILDNPIVEILDTNMKLFEGNNYIYLKETNDYEMYIKYLTNNELNKQYASKMELNSSINILENETNIKVKEKLDGKDFTHAEIVARINDDTSEAKINADNVNIDANDVLNILSGNEINLKSKNINIASDNFNVDKDGNMVCNNATMNNLNINGGNIKLTDNGTNNDLVLTSKSDLSELGIWSCGYYVHGKNVPEAEITEDMFFELGFRNGNMSLLLGGSGGYSSELTDYDLSFYSTNNNMTYINANGIQTPKVIGDNDVIIIDSKINSPKTYNNTSTGTVNMHITSNGYIARSTSSSKRYKKNIKNLSNKDLDVNKLLEVPIRQYKYKNNYVNKNDERYNKDIIGFIVEELEEYYPIAVDHNEDGKPEMWNSQIMIPAMLKIIQNQNKRIEILEEKIKELESDKNA